MDKVLLSQKGSITTEEEIILDTTISKVLNFLGALLIIAGIVIWLIILGRNEADLLDARQILTLCTLLVICIGGGVWFELKSQRHQKRKTFTEYIHDSTDYDCLQDGENYEGDYDYLLRMVITMPRYLEVMTIYDCWVWYSHGFELTIHNGHIVAIEKAAPLADESDQ